MKKQHVRLVRQYDGERIRELPILKLLQIPDHQV